ncbi:hypothetical protein FA15DRAFT_672407 [Coprinopsis marcescibilis]|uniref:Uncharacterized protein n=1 Tax=Coprinopsis marcescibilis TaxID=230819 RepID=A0A5C3L0A1_COPMA|nr:hypothetical protein FA15DRAFT_672407 [Coprinopsis marcescibilis]
MAPERQSSTDSDKAYKEKKGEITVNAFQATLSLLKEALSGPGVELDGFRAAVGGTLWILEMIGKMSENKGSYTQIMDECAHLAVIVASTTKKTTEGGKEIDAQFLNYLKAFGVIVKETKKLVKKMLKRHWFIRFLFAAADKHRIHELRRRLSSTKENMILYVTMDLYIAPPETKKEILTVENIANLAKILVERHIAAKQATSPTVAIQPVPAKDSITFPQTVSPDFRNLSINPGAHVSDSFKTTVHNTTGSNNNGTSYQTNYNTLSLPPQSYPYQTNVQSVPGWQGYH